MLEAGNVMCYYAFIITLGLLGSYFEVAHAAAARAPRVRCSRPDFIPNGSSVVKRGGMMMRISCRSGYTLMGNRAMDCINGKWVGDRPVCAKKGCAKPKKPENGQIIIEDELRAIVFCLDSHNLAGNRFSNCNGTHWDRPLGECRVRSDSVEHECDFETEDICGWVHEPIDYYEWKRMHPFNMLGVFNTGPRHDHTTMTDAGGHYMLMESLGRTQKPVSLWSPIYERALSLKTASCFRFYYFMYGSGVADLYVFVKPMSVSLDDMWQAKERYVKFHKSGNQNNLWNEAHFGLDEMETDFQIVFTATGGKSHLSDIAIDDVKLMTGSECKALDGWDHNAEETTEETAYSTEEAIFDTQSCESRCFEASEGGIVRLDGKLFLQCSCAITCILGFPENCCPDFKPVCLNDFGDDTDSTLLNEQLEARTEPNDNAAIEQEVFTTARTTTTRKPTQKTTASTTTTTTTTTPKPTTTSTTTMKPTTVAKTTTTPKPATKPTTTTTRKTTTPIPKLPPTVTMQTTTKTTTPTTTRMTTKKTTEATTKATTKATTNAITTTRETTPFVVPTKIPETSAITKVTPSPNEGHNYPRNYIDRQILRTENITTFHVVSGVAPNHLDGAAMMVIMLGLILAVITVGAIYHRYRDHMVAYVAKRMANGNNTRADEECTSITAEFSRKSSVESSSVNTPRMRSKRSKPRIFRSNGDMETPLILTDSDAGDDYIGLQNNLSSDL